MPNTTRPSAALALVLWLAAAPAGAQPATVPRPIDPADFARRVDSVMAPWQGTDRPGCAVGLSRGGRMVLERAYGMADLESGVTMTPATVVHAASVAKQFTALALLQLEREGRLSLDDTVRRWLPDLPAHYDGVTLRHLLTHTSGARDLFELLTLARGQLEGARITEADALGVVRRQRALDFAPGSQYSYSNTGYLLLAKVIERATGQPFARAMHARFFAPLGMSRTLVRDDITMLIPGRAVGYARRGTGWRLARPDWDVVGSTNLETTVGDLLRWARALDEGSFVDSALVARMQRPTLLTGGDSSLYGLGVVVASDRGVRVVEHGGRDPGFRAYLGRYVDHGVAVALLCNAAALDPVGLGRTIAGLTIGLPPQAPLPVPVRPDSVEAARRAVAWAGVYLEPSTRQVAELTVRDGVLYTDRVGGARVESISARRARVVGTAIALEFGEGVRAGYVVRWTLPGRRADAFVWKSAVAPRLDRAALGEYAGRYYSGELDAWYDVQVADSTLVLRAAAGAGLVARAVFADGFVSGEYTVQFARRGGRVTGFEISHPRARGVGFGRVEGGR